MVTILYIGGKDQLILCIHSKIVMIRKYEELFRAVIITESVDASEAFLAK